jgi:putative transcriptional regulator
MRHEKPESRRFEAIYDTAQDLRELGLFIDKRVMRECNALRVGPIPDYSGEQIRDLRKRYGLSRLEMAALFNTESSTIGTWEAGKRRPYGPSLKLLSIFDRQGIDVLLSN